MRADKSGMDVAGESRRRQALHISYSYFEWEFIISNLCGYCLFRQLLQPPSETRFPQN